MNQREKFSSRLGFILISAGCAIGLGNVYRFPIITSAYGGAFFVLIYIVFLFLLGLPIMTMELSVGRASQRSIASSFDVLEKPGQKWHFVKYVGVIGNYLLMMFYTTIAGWMLIYFMKYVSGSIMTAHGNTGLMDVFVSMVSSPVQCILAATAVIIMCFAVCALGLQKGVEKITKYMMIALFVLMVSLAVYSCTLPGTAEGLKFYLIPSLDNLMNSGIGTVLSAAMGQAFYTLSIGLGSIAVFGSYINKDRRLLGEAVTIVGLDTSVALISGLIVFPACFTYGTQITADSAGSLFLFRTLSSIFNEMPGGRFIGSMFFLFMLFAALSTVIAVFENIMSFWLEITKLSRVKIAIINICLLAVLAVPAMLSENLLSFIKIGGKTILDMEDFAVANLLQPIGSLVYVFFCTSRYGWGWSNYFDEVNCGSKGIHVPKWIKPYMSYVLPLIILVVMFMSLI